ncbi:MAG: DUF423 domain-containing protein [Deferribacteres bacterium]|nr:DUF423 domain-containing protein [candidate division KSB1 bacterium]MCB9509761.1 DUF423 domain-containing protein [Deferribacteres bacterium]
MKIWLISGAVFGMLSVALGAFGAHALKNTLDAYGRDIYEKAVLYQMFHALALLAVGVLHKLYPQSGFSFAGWAFLAGIVLFSGSLYVLAITGNRWLGAITPFGGVAFLIGWVWLIYTIIKASD